MGKLSGADVLVKCLVQEDVRFIFGIPGAQPITILDAIHRFGRSEGLEFIMTRHEQAAAHMADTYSRLTGRPGVCLGTVGPGAANLVPGVYEAYVNSIPILVLTAQNQTWRSYPDHGSTQGCDQLGLFKPITKWNALVSHWQRIPAMVQEAFRMATSGRPGPVHLDLPVDILFGEGDEEEIKILPPSRYRPTVPASGDPQLIKQAAEMLARARSPLIHAGGGALRSGASEEISKLAEFLGCPMTSGITARGTIPEDHPLSLISLGLGAVAARSQADLVLVVGSRLGALDFWGRPPVWGKPEEQKIIQVDTAPESLGENREVDLAILGDAKAAVRDIQAALETIAEPRSEHPQLAQYRTLQAAWLQNFEKLGQSDAVPIHPLRVVRDAREFFPRDAVFVTDGGNTTIWAHYLTRIYEPGTCLWCGDSGMGGGGLPKAIAAKLVYPERPVFAICGDGFFAMNIQEMETATRLGTNVVIIVNNDRAYGMIKAAQDGALGKRYIGVDFADVRYDKMAEAAGWYGERVEDPREITPALKRAVASGKPALLDVIIDAQANFAPPDFNTVVAVWLEGVTIPQY
ncbi:MAG: thiamine pyrophosphate-binding protein [Chloroflexota bacterium]|nr:thiamine pyrophosphate-binding protein [Chloroflexota bacterium]